MELHQHPCHNTMPGCSLEVALICHTKVLQATRCQTLPGSYLCHSVDGLTILMTTHNLLIESMTLLISSLVSHIITNHPFYQLLIHVPIIPFIYFPGHLCVYWHPNCAVLSRCPVGVLPDPYLLYMVSLSIVSTSYLLVV